MFHITPQLVVANLQRSIEFYTAHFGFVVTHRDPPDDPEFVALEREDNNLFLVSAASRTDARADALRKAPWGVGVRLYFEVDDAAVMYRHIKDAGIPIVRDLAVNEDENYMEFLISDPDGYEIGIYS